MKYLASNKHSQYKTCRTNNATYFSNSVIFKKLLITYTIILIITITITVSLCGMLPNLPPSLIANSEMAI